MKWLTDLAIDRPWPVLLALLVSTVLAAFGLRFIESDPDVLRDLPDDLPAKQLYDRVGEMFPGREMLFVGLGGDGLWTPQGMRDVDHLTRTIEELDVVQQVISPTNASVVEGTAEGMVIRDAAEDFPETPEQVTAFRRFLLQQKSLRGLVVSEDGEVASIVIFLSANLDTTESKAAGKVAEVIEANKGSLAVYPAGRPMMTYFSSKTIGKETGMLTSAALVLMIVLLGALFRGLRGVALPMTVVIIAVLWTTGLMGWTGIAFTHSLEALPIMLIAIGVADGVHIVQAYVTRATREPDKTTAVRLTMDDLRRPVIMTSVTTAAGFLALNTSGVRSIMTLGLLVAFGTGVALVTSLTLIPAALALLPVPKRARTHEVRKHGFFLQRVMRRWGDLLTDHTGLASLGILALVALAGLGATRVQSETSLLANLKASDPIAVSSHFVNDHFSGVTNLMVVFEGPPGSAKDPAFLNRIADFEGYVRTIDGVGGTSSIVPVLANMNQVLHGGDAAWDRLPGETEQERGFEYTTDEAGNEIEVPVTREVTGRQVLEGYFALFEMQGRGRDLGNFVTDDFSSAKVTVLLKSDRKQEMDRVVGDIRAYMDQHLAGTGVQVEMTGMAGLMLAVNDLITRGQSLSILVSLVLVFFITAAMFRSPVLGLCNVVPLFAAIFFNFGVMGLFGFDLNLMTMGVASMAIGVGVDFGIHFIHRYRVSFARAQEVRPALRLTFEESGVAILMNMVAVAGGFLPLLLASFKGVMTMGLLISLIMAFSAFGALTILPVIFVGVRPRAAEKLAVATLALLVALPARADEAGTAYMRKVLERNTFTSMVGTATLTLSSGKGADKVRAFKMASRDNDEGESDLVMRMEEPADMRGNGFLVVGHASIDDDRYIYVPALGRVNRIVGSGRGGSFMSSEFSYEDIGSPDLDEWSWTLRGAATVDGQACTVVEATPATDQIAKDTGYIRMVYYVDDGLLTSRKAEYYDKAGKLFKTMVVNRIETLGGVPFATDMTMTDHASGRSSRMVMADLQVNTTVDPGWFTKRALQQGF